jgi:hypothetical protein
LRRWQYTIACRWVCQHRSCTHLFHVQLTVNKDIPSRSRPPSRSRHITPCLCTADVTAYGWQTRCGSPLQAQSRRAYPARDGDSCAITSPANDVRYLYGSVSMIAGQRCAYRWSRPSVRGAFVIGDHGSLDKLRSSLCTIVNASGAVFIVTTRLPGFQDGSASSQSLGTLRSTWHAAVKLRYVSIGISLSQYICVCTPVQSSSHRMQITEQVFDGACR